MRGHQAAGWAGGSGRRGFIRSGGDQVRRGLPVLGSRIEIESWLVVLAWLSLSVLLDGSAGWDPVGIVSRWVRLIADARVP